MPSFGKILRESDAQGEKKRRITQVTEMNCHKKEEENWFKEIHGVNKLIKHICINVD
jgi:hypothetical protein